MNESSSSEKTRVYAIDSAGHSIRTVPVEITDLEMPYSSVRNTGELEHRLITAEIADPKCPLSNHIIQQVNEIFEQHDPHCPDPREYCITHLLETVHTSLVWRLSKQ
jgi:hypothetical protein